MKVSFFKVLVFAMVCCGLTACDKAAEDRNIINGYIVELNGDLSAMVEGVPALESVAVSFDSINALNVDVNLNTTNLKADVISEPLAQYTLAAYLKAHPGTRLDNILNALGRLEGKMLLNIKDCDDATLSYEIGSARLKKLVTLPPMDLGFNDVRTNVSNLMEQRSAQLADSAKAQSSEFTIRGGFAQYTFVFEKASKYRGYTQANIRGRYIREFNPIYEEWGTMRPFVVELLESLQIEGYRIIYTTENDANTISAAIPWRLFDNE